MKDVNVMLKLLLFLSFPHLLSTDTHTLQYLYTADTPGVNFTAVGLMDGKQFVYYDINMRRISEWMKAEANDPDYWRREMERVKNQQDSFQNNVAKVMKRFNQSEGVHTLQRIYGCERDDDGTTRGYDQYGYDGENFISLNLTTGTWTAANETAKNFINEWDPKGDKAKHWKDFLQTNCIDQLQKVLNYGNETLERKVPPTASVFQKHSSPEVVCHATGFFPKTVNITWQKDGEDVHEDLDLSETLPNQDGSFQKRSILTVSAEDLQKHTYTCVIQHSGLEKEIVLHEEDIRILNPDRRTGGGSGGGSGGAPIGIIVGVPVAVVLIAVVGGIVYWKKKNFDFTLVAGSDSPPIPVSDSTPIPVSDATLVPVSDSTSVPVSDSTSVPVSDSTPIPVSDSTLVPVSDSERHSEVMSSSSDGPASGEAESEV